MLDLCWAFIVLIKTIGESCICMSCELKLACQKELNHSEAGKGPQVGSPNCSEPELEPGWPN